MCECLEEWKAEREGRSVVQSQGVHGCKLTLCGCLAAGRAGLELNLVVVERSRVKA